MTALEVLQHVEELLTVAEDEGATRPEDYEALEVLVSLLDERDKLRKDIEPFSSLIYFGKNRPDWLEEERKSELP